MAEPQDNSFLELTADIVSAFVSNHAMRASEVGELISSVYSSLKQIGEPKVEEEPVAAPTPATSIKKSITDDYLICLDDGKRFKSLKRHLSRLGMTPAEYRAKWGLPSNYPMVAPGYAAKRSELAKATGLGRKGATAEDATVADDAEVPPANDAMPEPAKRRAAAKSATPSDETMVAEGAPAKRRGRPKKAA